jgi:hypothetical protein
MSQRRDSAATCDWELPVTKVPAARKLFRAPNLCLIIEDNSPNIGEEREREDGHR